MGNKVVNVIENHQPEKMWCAGKGHPPLNYIWMKNGSTSEQPHKSAIYQLGLMKRSDSGTYICEAWNKHGNKTITVYVNVQCKY